MFLVFCGPIVMGCTSKSILFHDQAQGSLNSTPFERRFVIRLNWITNDNPVCNQIYKNSTYKIMRGKDFCVIYLYDKELCTIVTKKITTHAVLGEAMMYCRFARTK
jgi:hypothetical protein